VNDYISLLKQSKSKIAELQKENKGISLALSLPSSNESSKQQSRIAELEDEKLHMQISMTCVRELIGNISAFVENIEPRSSESVTIYNQCTEICHAINEMNLPEFEFEALKE
jgi:hypothetical protein